MLCWHQCPSCRFCYDCQWSTMRKEGSACRASNRFIGCARLRALPYNRPVVPVPVTVMVDINSTRGTLPQGILHSCSCSVVVLSWCSCTDPNRIPSSRGARSEKRALRSSCLLSWEIRNALRLNLHAPCRIHATKSQQYTLPPINATPVAVSCHRWHRTALQ